jgi:hypothetical protein
MGNPAQRGKRVSAAPVLCSLFLFIVLKLCFRCRIAEKILYMDADLG